LRESPSDMDPFLPLAFDRETLIIAALVAQAVAGAVMALGAVVLFRRERAGPVTPRSTTEPRDEERPE
jgi:hypothetical protein